MAARNFDYSFIVESVRLKDNIISCQIMDDYHCAWYDFSCSFLNGKFIFNYPYLPKPSGLFPYSSQSGLDIRYAENELWLNLSDFLRDCLLRKNLKMPQKFFLYEPF